MSDRTQASRPPTLNPVVAQVEELVGLVGYQWWDDGCADDDWRNKPEAEMLVREIPEIKQIETQLEVINTRLRAQGFDNPIRLFTGDIVGNL